MNAEVALAPRQQTPLLQTSRLICSYLVFLFIAVCFVSLFGLEAAAAAAPEVLAEVQWPEGTQVLSFEDVDGAILVRGTLTSTAGVDTSGLLLLDTGSGYLAVDIELSRILGLSDSAASAAAVNLAARPLPRLELGWLQIDQVSPVLTVDADIIRRVTGRPVLGLAGQALMRDRVAILDYPSGTLVLLPPEAAPGAAPAALRLAFSPGSVAVPLHVAGDGKAIVRALVAGPGGDEGIELSLIVDTGATKSVLFGPALDRRLPGWRSWPALRGLGAPTLMGDEKAAMVRVPLIELETPEGAVARRGMDAAILGGDLSRLLEAEVGEPVDGLLGYSFLKHFRVALDYPRGLLWLDSTQGGVPDRPEEYCSPGVQLESVAGSIRVLAVAVGSPAARAGIRAGDELLTLDGERLAGTEVVAIGRRLEGQPGSRVTLGLRRGAREWSRRVVRRRLL